MLSYPITGLKMPLGLQEDEGSKNSSQLAHEVNKVVRPKQRTPLPPKRYPWYSFLFEAGSIPES